MKRSWQLAMGLILIVAGPAAAQVSRIQNGRALDSNYLIGARGYNSIRRANRALDGNLLVTGQVAGGYHFRGDVGYVGSDQFRGELPSAGLDNFIRGSAGLDRLTSGGSYGPGAYYSSQRTVLGASRISKGLNAPGSSMPLRTYVPPAQYRQLEEQTLRAYEPVQARLDSYSRNTRLDLAMAPGQSSRVPVLPPASATQASPTRPAMSVLFGVLPRSDRQSPEEDPSPARAPGMGEPLDTRLAGTRGQFEPLDTRLSRSGQDVYLDLLQQLDRMRREQAPPPPPEPRRAGEPVPTGPTGPLAPPEEDQQAQLRQQEKADQALERTRNQVVLYKLAGKSRDMFNRRMALAENALKQGKFYKAADNYRIAAILNRENPLAYLGRALALFAVDEPLSAAFQLRQAMERFPPLMSTGVDVQGLVGETTVANRIKRLEDRLTEPGAQPEPSLVFLATFIRSAMGQRELATAHAKRLQQISEDEIHRAYARTVVAGPTEPKNTTTQSARRP